MINIDTIAYSTIILLFILYLLYFISLYKSDIIFRRNKQLKEKETEKLKHEEKLKLLELKEKELRLKEKEIELKYKSNNTINFSGKYKDDYEKLYERIREETL